MLIKEISDVRLESFPEKEKIQNKDILKFNFLNGEANELDGEVLDLLKKYQRLLRINPDLKIAKKLLKAPSSSQARQAQASTSSQPVIDSAHAIASMTEAQFVKMMPGDEATARQMHKKAVDIKAKTQLLWANMKDAVASPHFRSMRVSTTQESDRAALDQDFSNYQEMLGDLRYIDWEHCDSIFSPTTYFAC